MHIIIHMYIHIYIYMYTRIYLGYGLVLHNMLYHTILSHIISYYSRQAPETARLATDPSQPCRGCGQQFPETNYSQ